MGTAFEDMIKSDNYKGVVPDLRSIYKKSRPKANCPNWYKEGLVEADLAVVTDRGWTLTPKGMSILNSSGVKL